MKIGDTVRVTDNALHLWQDDENLLTPALLVHLGAPNLFTVKDVTADGEGEYLVLACCRAFKLKGAEICHDHPVEFFEACEAEHVSAPPNDGAAPADDAGAAPVQDNDAETSVSVPVLGQILSLGYTRESGGKLSLRIPGLEAFEIKGGLSKVAANFLKKEKLL